MAVGGRTTTTWFTLVEEDLEIVEQVHRGAGTGVEHGMGYDVPRPFRRSDVEGPRLTRAAVPRVLHNPCVLGGAGLLKKIKVARKIP